MTAVKIAEAPSKDDDLVDEAGMDSFPASDPPSFWARGNAPVAAPLSEEVPR